MSQTIDQSMNKGEAEATPNVGGRPLKFETVEDLRTKIAAYFDECDPHITEITEWVQARDSSGSLKKDKNGLNFLVEVIHRVLTEQVPYTITGLALALGTTRETLLDYQERDGFSDTVKAAKLRCENFNEVMLYGPSPVGTIFNLKNNYGWRDKSEVDQHNTGNLTVELVSYEDAASDPHTA